MNIQKDIITIFGVCLFLLTPIWVFTGWYNQLPETIVVHAAEWQEPEVGGGESAEEDSVSLVAPSPTPTAEEYIEQVFGEDAENAKRVAFCESSMNPKAKSNISSATGLFQILQSTWKLYQCEGSITNYMDNTDCAKKIFDSNGDFRQWVCQP